MLNLDEITSQRVKAFVASMTHDILEKIQSQVTSSPGIYTCLKELARLVPIPELALVLFIAENQPVKKSYLATSFLDALGYSTIYRKLKKLLSASIVEEGTDGLRLAAAYQSLSLVAGISSKMAK